MQLAPEIDSHALKRLTRRRFLRGSNERSPFFFFSAPEWSFKRRQRFPLAGEALFNLTTAFLLPG